MLSVVGNSCSTFQQSSFLSPLAFLTKISWTRAISISHQTFYIKFEETFWLVSCWKSYRVLNVNLKSALSSHLWENSTGFWFHIGRKWGEFREWSIVSDTRQPSHSLTSLGAPLESRATKNWSIASFSCSPPRKSLVKGERFIMCVMKENQSCIKSSRT